MKENAYTKIINALADRVRTMAKEELPPKIRGGDVPPGKKRVPRERQLADYLLACQLDETLLPEQLERKQEIAAKFIQGKERWQVAEWCLAMEKLRVQQAGGAQELAEATRAQAAGWGMVETPPQEPAGPLQSLPDLAPLPAAPMPAGPPISLGPLGD